MIFSEIGRDQIKRWRSILFSRPRLSSLSRRCCLRISADALDLICCVQSAGKMEIQLQKSFSFEKKFQPSLVEFVEQNGLQEVRCTLVLQSPDYQLLLMPTLPVTSEEFQSAIRWKVKELLNLPMEDTVVDSFSLPIQKTQDAHQMMMIVVSRLSLLQSWVDQIQASGLVMDVIDITELALRNILLLSEQPEKTSALIYVQQQQTQLLILRQKTLYLSRVLDLGTEKIVSLTVSPEGAEPLLERLVLEIQRSFDYFHAQWRLPVPTSMMVSSEFSASMDLRDYLSKRLNVAVTPFDLSSFIVNSETLHLNMHNKYLPLFGSALREQVDYATEN